MYADVGGGTLLCAQDTSAMWKRSVCADWARNTDATSYAHTRIDAQIHTAVLTEHLPPPKGEKIK